MRRHRLIRLLATVTVISSGLIMLVGLASEPGTMPADLADFTLQLISVTAALAVLIGIVNLVTVHLGRFVRSDHGWPYSIVVLITALGVIVLRILDRADVWPDDLQGEEVSARAFEAIQVSLESALGALVCFFLVYAAYRLMRREVTLWHVVFITTVIIVVAGWIPLENTETLMNIREWLVTVPAGAGARGLLIGVGLGTLTVGVRVLVGQDRSFRG